MGCPFRQNDQCQLINEKLGWPHGCPASTCEKCLSLGGPGAKEADDFRDSEAKKWAIHVKENIHRATPSHVDALVRLHLTPEEAAEFLKQPETQAALGRVDSWTKVKPTWEMAESFVKSMASKGFTAKKVELTIKNKRHISCFGKDLDGKVVSLPCPSLAVSSDGKSHFCNSCGCGDRQVARLDGVPYSKLDYPYLECPRRRPGFSNEITEAEVIFDGRAAGLGDLLASFWLSEGYKLQGKSCSYYVDGDKSKKELLKMFGMNEVFTLPSRHVQMGGSAPYYHYEVSTDKGKNNRLDVWASQLAGKPVPTAPKFQISEEVRKLAREEVAKRGKPFVMLFPFSNWNPRQWPTNLWVDLAYTLNHHKVQTGTFAGKDQQHEISPFPFYYAGFNLTFVAAMMLEADLVVANDSGPAWLASCLGVPTIALMGPTSNIFTKSPNTMELSQKQLACTGCHFDGGRGYRAACDKSCRSLQLLSAEEVFEEIMKCLGNPTYIRTARRNSPTSSPQTTPVALSMSILNYSKALSDRSSPAASSKPEHGRAWARNPLRRLWQRINGAFSYAWTRTQRLSNERRHESLRSRAQKALPHSFDQTP